MPAKHMRPVKITKIERRPCTSPVYNLAVDEDESYVAEGVVVHNCRSVLVPVTVIDGWDGQESDPPNVEPQSGFK